MIRKIHDWSEEDEGLLSQAVMDLDPLREEYAERAVPLQEFWSAVAGRIAPQVVVTGKACRERWKAIEERRKAAEQPEEPDAWAKVAARVEQYERDLGEATYDAAAETLRSVEFIRERLESSHAAADVAVSDLHSEVVLLCEECHEMSDKLDKLLAEWGVE